MKTKKFNKSLSLNKETVSDLNLDMVKGGVYTDIYQCPDTSLPTDAVTICIPCSNVGLCLSCHQCVGCISAEITQCIMMAD